jgi:hypothetical protein
LDRDTRKVINSLKEGVGSSYYAYRVQKVGSVADKVKIRVEVAALLQVEGVAHDVETAATKFVQDQLARYSVEIKNTTGARRDAFRKVQEQTSSLEAVMVELRDNEKVATKSGDGSSLKSFDGHIYSDTLGKFPGDLNDWETETIEKEIARLFLSLGIAILSATRRTLFVFHTRTKLESGGRSRLTS